MYFHNVYISEDVAIKYVWGLLVDAVNKNNFCVPFHFQKCGHTNRLQNKDNFMYAHLHSWQVTIILTTTFTITVNYDC